MGSDRKGEVCVYAHFHSKMALIVLRLLGLWIEKKKKANPKMSLSHTETHICSFSLFPLLALMNNDMCWADQAPNQCRDVVESFGV